MKSKYNTIVLALTILSLSFLSLTVSATLNVCTDSDSGKDYYTQGELDIGCEEGTMCGVFNDYCKDQTTLIENYCENEEPMTEEYTCSEECSNGACKELEITSQGTSPGSSCQNYPGPDFCPEGTSDIIITGKDSSGCQTYGCKSTDCPAPNCINPYETGEFLDNGCPVMACPEITTVCIDSDSGKDYYTQGSLDIGCPEGATCGTFTDYCKDKNTLIENYCKDKEPMGEEYTCPEGCLNGVCKKLETQNQGSITLTETGSGEVIIKSQNREATTSESVKIVESKLIMESQSGEQKQIRIMPEELTPSFLGVTKIEKIQLEESSGKPIYEIRASKAAKLFFIFPMDLLVETRVDAETGEIISTKKPWWSIFANE